MMGKDQELGLSLSLSFNEKTNTAASNPTSLHLNLMPSFPSSPSPNPFTVMNKNWADLFHSSDKSSDLRKDETRFFLKGIDVNSLPEEEEEAGVSSPNSTVSTSSGKRSEREHTGGISDDEDARKKLRLSKDQSAVLEESFKEHNTLNPKQKQALAKRLRLRPRQVEVWFQNRRARTKLKQTEVDCEYLKRCCEKLTEENRRLQKEVQELRALKLSPAQMYMQMNPPTTLTMCPSCKRVAAAPAANQRRPLAAAATCVHPQSFAFNPWAAATPIPHRQFDALQKARSWSFEM